MAHPIPFAFRDKARAELEYMTQMGIIEDVMSLFIVIGKPNRDVLLVVDYKGLNKYMKHPIYPFPTVFEIKSSIPPNAKWFATLDATKGY